MCVCLYVCGCLKIHDIFKWQRSSRVLKRMQNCEYNKKPYLYYSLYRTHVKIMMPQSLLIFFSRLLLSIAIKVLAQSVSARINK